MYTVTKLKQTCYACPAQWEGTTDKAQDVYIRYRWGYLRLDIDGETVHGEQVGDAYDGTISFEVMTYTLRDYITVKEDALQ